MKSSKHFDICEAPICQEDHEGVWYAGESICNKKPLQRFQKIQIEVNKTLEQGKFRHIDTPYTKEDLENRSI